MDFVFGYLLYLLGINKTPPMVMGDTTATTSASLSARINNTSHIGSETSVAKEIRLHKETMEKNLQTIEVKMRERHKAQQDELKMKLLTISDEKKKTIVASIGESLMQINVNRTTALKTHLGKMSDVLSEISSKSQSIGSTTTLDTAISEAKTALTAARTALEMQASKTYTITITGTVGALKADVSTARKLLASDLSAVQKKVNDAREAVKKALLEYRNISPTPTQ